MVEEYWDSAASGKPSPIPADGSVVMGTSQTSVTVKALFDSTHFADSSTITIKLKVTDSNNGYYEAAVTGPAYNKGYILTNGAAPGFKYFGFAIHRDLIDSDISSINYTAMSSSYHRKSAILANVPSYTFLYVSSHANSNGFGDCYDSDGYGELVPYLSSGNPPSPSIQDSVGSKTSNQPPYNFAMVDGCDSAGGFQPNGTFIQGGGANGFGISTHDRAFLGWGEEMDGCLDYNWSETVIGGLESGETLWDAIEEATTDFPPIGPPPGSLTDQVTHPQLFISPVIIGDPLFKLHGVYLGFSSGTYWGAQWFRPLR